LCVKLMEDPDPGVRMRILNAIADAGPKATTGLIFALKNDSTADDYWALLALREIGPAAKDAMPAVVKMLKDPRAEIRREAILTLAAMEEAAKSAAAEVASGLYDKDTAVAATYALGRIGEIPKPAPVEQPNSGVAWRQRTPEETIQRNAKSDDKLLSTVSIWALARVHPEDKQLRAEATEQLIARLKDKDQFVRVAAARALASLPPAPEITEPIWKKAFTEADETTVSNALDALAALGPAAVPRLIDALKHEKVRGQVVYVLGKIGPAAAPATEALAKLVADKDDRVAQEAILALAHIGPGAKAAVPALLEALAVAVPGALQKDEASNAHAIVYALGKIGPDAVAAEPALSALLSSSDGNLALTSAWALAQIHPAPGEIAAKIAPVLAAGLKNPLPLARQGAAEALGALGPAAADAVPALEQLRTDKDEAVRAAAAKALNAIRPGAAEQK
jgi:HEAT repeat protein